MAETDKYRSWTSFDRYALSTNDPEEHRRVRLLNIHTYCGDTDTSHSEALTRELTFLVGFELEFTLLMDQKGTEVLDDHDWSTSSSLHCGAPAEILDAMVTALERGGIVVHSFHAEAGPGQYKIVTGPLQPLQAADALSFSRDVIRGTASGYQRRATFAPWIHEHQCTAHPLAGSFGTLTSSPRRWQWAPHSRLRPLYQGLGGRVLSSRTYVKPPRSHFPPITTR